MQKEFSLFVLDITKLFDVLSIYIKSLERHILITNNLTDFFQKIAFLIEYLIHYFFK